MTKVAFLAFAALLGGGALVSTVVLVVSVFVIGWLSVRVKWLPVSYNLRSLGNRRVTTGLTILGMALVVAVFAGVLMLRSGIKNTLVSAGRPDNAVVLRKGATSEITSVVTRAQARLLGAIDELAKGEDGKPLFDPQLCVLIFAQRPGGEPTDGANVLVRGTSERNAALHPGLKLASGRWFRPGTSEVVIGKALVGRFVGAQEGSDIPFIRRQWRVVGVLDGAGSGFDSEIWGDVDQLMEAFGRPAYSSVTLQFADASTIGAVASRTSADQRLQLDVKQEQKYFDDLSNNLSVFIGFIGIFVAVVFSLGATLGAMIAMYAQVAARTREVGTLRALGYQRDAVLVSFVIESLLLGLLAGGVGVVFAMPMQLASFTTLNFNTFSEVTFRFRLTPGIVAEAIVFAVVMGYAGGLLPAVRAARLAITEAVRA